MDFMSKLAIWGLILGNKIPFCTPKQYETQINTLCEKCAMNDLQDPVLQFQVETRLELTFFRNIHSCFIV